MVPTERRTGVQAQQDEPERCHHCRLGELEQFRVERAQDGLNCRPPSLCNRQAVKPMQSACCVLHLACQSGRLQRLAHQRNSVGVVGIVWCGSTTLQLRCAQKHSLAHQSLLRRSQVQRSEGRSDWLGLHVRSRKPPAHTMHPQPTELGRVRGGGPARRAACRSHARAHAMQE